MRYEALRAHHAVRELLRGGCLELAGEVAIGDHGSGTRGGPPSRIAVLADRSSDGDGVSYFVGLTSVVAAVDLHG